MVAAKGKLYMYGGQECYEDSSTFYEWDPATERWTKLQEGVLWSF